MTVPKARSEAERHAVAKAAIPQVEQRIDNLLERRRQILREHDANSLDAIRADREIVALRALRLRYIDQITLLESRMAAEQQQQRQSEWPTSLEAVQAQLLAVAPEIERRQAVPRVDRSARFDAELDGLVNRQYRLLRLAESFQPKSMVAS